MLFTSLVACKKDQEGIRPTVASLTESVYSSVTIQPDSLYEVYATVSGILDQTFVTEGDLVSLGSPLVQVTNTMPELNTENAKIALQQAQLNAGKNSKILAGIQDQITTAKLKLANDKLNYQRQQATKSTTRLYGGTGLGLSIVKSIINAMGSEIHLESTPDVGSRFYFDINVDIADTQNSNDGDKENNDLNGLHILLVEDNEINVMVAKQVLENVNAKVSVATNGQEAVNMMALETTYDVVLMDIQMPIKDGYEAAKEIRLSNKTTPILALSASVFMEVRDKINECGMNGFIFKPFVPDDLLKEVKDAAGQTPSAY